MLPFLPPPGQRHRDWAVASFTLGGYIATFALLVALVRPGGSAAQQAAHPGTFLAFIPFFAALLLVVCTVWLIARAHVLRTRLTVAQGVGMGMLADLLVLRGLEQLYRPASGHWTTELFLLLVAGGSLILLTVAGNADSLRRRSDERHLLETDELTGLLNRRGVIRRYAELLPDEAVTVVMLDLNDLKAINDAGGHSAGDQHLKATARDLQFWLPAGAFLGRWGGDEFVAVLPGQADVAALMEAVQTQVPHPDSTLIPFAVGAAAVQAVVPLERALALADQQMYADKSAIYRDRARNLGQHVNAATFPHFLLELTTQRQILEEGARQAARLADFEGWFLLQYGEVAQLTHQESADGPIQQVTISSGLQSRGVLAAVAEQREMIWAADYENSPYVQPHWLEVGLKSIAAAPVMRDGAVVAAVGFTSHRTWRSVRPQAEQLLEAVAIRLGQQLERDRVLERLQASVEANIVGMGFILEARDLETAGHTARVVELALALGAAAGLQADELHALRMGAYLHDVGKLAIPDGTLLKPGALD